MTKIGCYPFSAVADDDDFFTPVNVKGATIFLKPLASFNPFTAVKSFESQNTKPITKNTETLLQQSATSYNADITDIDDQIEKTDSQTNNPLQLDSSPKSKDNDGKTITTSLNSQSSTSEKTIILMMKTYNCETHLKHIHLW